MNHSIEIDFSAGPGKKLYVFFGGIAAGIAMPPFEFYKASKIVADNKIFVRDFSQTWYHSGIPPHSKTLAGAAAQLTRLIQSIAPSQVYLVGNSMGGFAAILFSRLLRCGDVIAFSPQTFISPSLRRKHGDTRWAKEIRTTHFRSMLKPRAWDLKKTLQDSDYHAKISIYFSQASKLDTIHAGHLKDLNYVHLHPLGEGGHQVVKYLRDRGQLSAIMSGGDATPNKPAICRHSSLAAEQTRSA